MQRRSWGGALEARDDLAECRPAEPLRFLAELLVTGTTTAERPPSEVEAEKAWMESHGVTLPVTLEHIMSNL